MTVAEAILDELQAMTPEKQQMLLKFAKFLTQEETVDDARYEQLRQEVLIGVEAAERGEVLDSEVVFSSIQAKLDQRRAQAS